MHQAPRRHAFAARHPWLGPSGCSSLPQRRNSSRICQSSTGIPAETSNFPAEISHFPAEFQRNEVTIMPTYPRGQTRQCAEFEAALQCSALWRCHAASAPITFYLFLSTFMTAEGCNGPASMASLRFHTPPVPYQVALRPSQRWPACSPRALIRLSPFSRAAWRQLQPWPSIRFNFKLRGSKNSRNRTVLVGKAPDF